MNKEKLEYFRNLLIWQRQQAIEDLRADRTTAGRPHLIQDIDAALRRIENGTYGQCVRCGKPLYVERLKVMPTAKYGPKCQWAIETAQQIETPTL
jgi:RNA polymerase-binding transcription factor DksA